MSEADVELCRWLMATFGWSYKRAMRAVESGAGARLRDTLAVSFGSKNKPKEMRR